MAPKGIPFDIECIDEMGRLYHPSYIQRRVEKKMSNKMVSEYEIESNKFYVGSNSIFERKIRSEGKYNNWGHSNIGDAVDHAAKILEKNPDQEYCFVVEIKKVVRRKPVELPIVVEDV